MEYYETDIIGHHRNGKNRRFYSGFDVFRSDAFMTMINDVFPTNLWDHTLIETVYDKYLNENIDVPINIYGFDVWRFDRKNRFKLSMKTRTTSQK